MFIFQVCVWYWYREKYIGVELQSWIQSNNGGYVDKISANNLLKISNYLCILIISCKNQKLSQKMTYVMYEIYVTAFLNKVHINMFTAFVICNQHSLYKKRELLLCLFCRRLFVIAYILTRLKEGNFATNQG